MGEVARGDREAPRVDVEQEASEDRVHLARWYLRGKFGMMARLLELVDRPPERVDAEAARRRFDDAVRRVRPVLAARSVVSVLLALGILAAATAAVAAAVWIPPPFRPDLEAFHVALERAAVLAGSITLALVALRVAFDRYLEIAETTATFAAIEIARARR